MRDGVQHLLPKCRLARYDLCAQVAQTLLNLNSIVVVELDKLGWRGAVLLPVLHDVIDLAAERANNPKDLMYVCR